MSDLYELIAIIESELRTSYFEYIAMFLDIFLIAVKEFKYLNMNLAKRDTSSYFHQQKLFIDLWMIYRKFITDYL